MAFKGRHSTSQERLRAVRLLKAGNTAEQVADAFDVSRAALFKWQQKYDRSGPAALEAKRTPGPPPRLNRTQVSQLYAIITGCDPRHLQFDCWLWTRKIIKDLIRQEFGVDLSEVQVGRLLAKMGLRTQRPVDPQWKTASYPKIRQLAAAAGASIFFEHEASIRNEHHAGTVRQRAGQPPVVVPAAGRKPMNMISAISSRGKLRFRMQEGRVNADMFIGFLSALLDDVQGEIFLIAEGRPAHKSKKVNEFMRGEPGRRMRIFFMTV